LRQVLPGGIPTHVYVKSELAAKTHSILGASPVPLESHACGAQRAPQARFPEEVQFPGGIDSMPPLYRDFGSSSQESNATMEGNHAAQPRNAPERAWLSRMPRYFFHLAGDLPAYDLMGHECADNSDAERHGRLLAHNVGTDKPWMVKEGNYISVTDSQGRELFQIPLASRTA
jgi:hypothetical protein